MQCFCPTHFVECTAWQVPHPGPAAKRGPLNDTLPNIAPKPPLSHPRGRDIWDQLQPKPALGTRWGGGGD